MIKLFKLFCIILVLSTKGLYGQTFEVKQEYYTVHSDHGYWAKKVDSLGALPEKIQRTLRVVLTEKLGKALYEKLTFEYGQVVDLDNHFASSLPSRRIIPKYDLIYLLSDNTLGIKEYYLNIDLDTYGQVLSINWPSKTEKDQFAPIQELYEFALNYGKELKLSDKSMVVDLEYDKERDILYWTITYDNAYKEKRGYSDHVIKLHLSSLRVLKQYITFPDSQLH